MDPMAYLNADPTERIVMREIYRRVIDRIEAPSRG
jgi:hypothetical protein